MAEIRVGIANAVNGGEEAFIEEFLPAREVGMQTQLLVDLDDFLLRNASRLFAVLVIFLVAVGNERVQRIVAAIELQNHEDALVRFGLWSGQGRADQKIRQRRADADQAQTAA